LLTEEEKTAKYNAILAYFNFQFDTDGLHSPAYVSLDDVHDAIIKVGIELEAPEKHYIRKAKQFAINNFNYGVKRRKLAKKNYKQGNREQFDYDILNHYGFTEDEKSVIIERLSGVFVANSKYNWYVYYALLESIKKKVSRHKEA